jgi:hypothetical protein
MSLQPMVTYYDVLSDKYNYRLHFFALPALTGSYGFDQCPAPFGRPHRLPPLQIDPPTPDMPSLTPN